MGNKLCSSKNKRKRPILIVSLILAVVVAVYFIAQSFVTSKIKNAIKSNLEENIVLNYADLNVNLLLEQVNIYNIQIKCKDSVAKKDLITIEKIAIEDLNFSALLRTGTIEINRLIIENLKISVFIDKNRKKSSFDSEKPSFKKGIKIKNLEINNAIVVAQTMEDSILCRVDNLALHIKNLKLNETSLDSQIPFQYDSFKLTTGNVFFAINAFENIHMASVALDDTLIIRDFALKTKYTKEQMHQKIYIERDHVDLKIPIIALRNFNFKGPENSFQIKASSVLLKKLNLEIYRNKLLADDTTIKQLFGRKIKQVSFPINLPLLKIENGRVQYSELVSEQSKAGKIVFTELNSEITNLSNLSTEPILFKNKAKLMGVAPLLVDWSFYTENGANLFKASGIIKNFKTTAINPFLESNLRARAKGAINELYFTISGDGFVSSGTMKMNYNDFEFVVLKKDRLGVNKVLTVLGKIFTNDGSKTDQNGYRFGEISVKRDPTKSFFNYLWINVQDGIISTFTGNGKKEAK